MRQFLKDLWMVCVERAKTKRALRILKGQEWSVEFLTALLNKAAAFKKSNVTVMLQNGGVQMVINAEYLAPAEHNRKESAIDLQQQGITLDSVLEAAWESGLMR